MTEPPQVPIHDTRRSILERVSVVWVVPIAALAIALGVAWQAYVDRGPVIEIAFESATGIGPGETELRFRDVPVGVVEGVGFSATLEQVVVTVRLDKDIAPFVDDSARFWIVQPEVTTRGVTGLDTVLSGVFIEGAWDPIARGLVIRHEGLAREPLLGAGEKGLRILLRATEGTSLMAGTPVLYKGIEVGEIGTPELTGNGAAAVAEAVIRAPYDRLVTTSTRFWDTSGFTFSIGANGAVIDFSSIASLISGGVAFETVVSGGRPAEDGTAFDLFVDEGAARASLFTEGDGPVLNLTVIFSDNVSGLTSGAPVELAGVTIGEVANLTGVIDSEQFGDERVRLLATLSIRPARLGLGGEGGEGEALDFLEEQVRDGLRARLVTASLLTGGLKVELVDLPNPPPGELDRSADPFPLLPSAPSDVTDVSASAEGVLQRINDLPIEALIGSALAFLDTATALIGSEEAQAVPGEVNGLIGDIRGVVGSDEVQRLPADLSILMTELQAAVGDMRAILIDLEDVDAASRLLEAVDAATRAAQDVSAGVQGVPELVASLTAVADKAATLPLEDLVAEVAGLVKSADALVADPETRDIPASLNAALAELRGALAELRAGETVETIKRSVAAAGRAAEAIETAAVRLPELVARIEALVAQADATVAGFDPGSGFSQDLREALRGVEAAADAVEDLARTLERRPNSIILGR